MFSYSSNITIRGGMPMCCYPPMPMMSFCSGPVFIPPMTGCCTGPIFNYGCCMPIMNNSMAAGWCAGTALGLLLRGIC